MNKKNKIRLEAMGYLIKKNPKRYSVKIKEEEFWTAVNYSKYLTYSIHELQNTIPFDVVSIKTADSPDSEYRPGCYKG